MRRGLVVLLSLYSSWSLAETRSVEVCLNQAPFVREINHQRGEVLIDAGERDADRRGELIELLRDRAAVVNAAGGARVDELIAAITEDGAIVTPGLKGTAPDCVNVLAGHDAWTRLSSAEIEGR